MRFKVTVEREGAGVAFWIKEDDLEVMFTKDTQIMILKAYTKYIEEKI